MTTYYPIYVELHEQPCIVIGGGKIAPEINAARPPSLFGEAGDFQNQLALALRHRLELIPVRQI